MTKKKGFFGKIANVVGSIENKVEQYKERQDRAIVVNTKRFGQKTSLLRAQLKYEKERYALDKLRNDRNRAQEARGNQLFGFDRMPFPPPQTPGMSASLPRRKGKKGRTISGDMQDWMGGSGNSGLF